MASAATATKTVFPRPGADLRGIGQHFVQPVIALQHEAAQALPTASRHVAGGIEFEQVHRLAVKMADAVFGEHRARSGEQVGRVFGLGAVALVAIAVRGRQCRDVESDRCDRRPPGVPRGGERAERVAVVPVARRDEACALRLAGFCVVLQGETASRPRPLPSPS